MNIKKIETQKYEHNGDYVDNIEEELKKDRFDFTEDTIVFEDFFQITSSDDEIAIMEKAEIVYVDEKRYYAIVKDELGDYAICSLKKDSSSKIAEFIKTNLS